MTNSEDYNNFYAKKKKVSNQSVIRFRTHMQHQNSEISEYLFISPVCVLMVAAAYRLNTFRVRFLTRGSVFNG